MPNGALCQRCVGGQRPEVYVVSLAGTCCKCGVSEKEPSVCGTCQAQTHTPCNECTEFNGYFELPAAKEGDCSRYVKEFPSGKGPCGATSIELRLTPHTDPKRVNACVYIHFDQSAGPVRPVSWGRTGVGNCCEIGCLRRRSTNGKCCWPHEITVTPVPVPDFTAPQPEWLPGDPDDLNDAPFWPTLDLDLREDSPEAPVRYCNGELQLRIKDLGADGLGVPWGHTRIYSNRLSNSYDFGNGYNWLIHEQPRLVRFKTPLAKTKKFHEQEQLAGEPTGCTVVMLRGTRNALWFDEYGQGDSRRWYARFGTRHRLTYEGGKRCRFHVTAPNGHRWEFFDFTYPHSKALQLAGLTLEERLARVPGALVRHEGPGGQEARLTYQDCRLQKVERFASPYATPGSSAVPRGLVETYAYTYFPLGPHQNRIRYVTLSRKGTPIARAEYLYYDQGQPFGNEGDLKLAVRQLPRNANGNGSGQEWNNIDVHYYRYEKKARDTYCQGMLQMVVGPEHFCRAVKKKVWKDELQIIAKTPLAELAKEYADQEDLIPHVPTCPLADLFIVYDHDELAKYPKKRRVTTLYMNGGGRVHQFEYKDGFDEINYNAWHRKCVETLVAPKTAQLPKVQQVVYGTRVVYSTFVGRNILTQLIEGASLDPEEKKSEGAKKTDKPKTWIQYRVYHPAYGDLVLDSTPSAVRGFSQSNWLPAAGEVIALIEKRIAVTADCLSEKTASYNVGTSLDISSLRVEFNCRDALLQFLGYDGSRWLNHVRISNNASDSSDFQVHRLARYCYDTSHQIACGPFPSAEVEFEAVHAVCWVKVWSSDSRSAATAFEYEWLDGGFPLGWSAQITKRTTTLPTVGMDENGSGRADRVQESFDAHGYRRELMDERGVLTAWSYDIAKDTVNIRGRSLRLPWR